MADALIFFQQYGTHWIRSAKFGAEYVQSIEFESKESAGSIESIR